MVHVKFQDYMTLCSGEEEFIKVLSIYWHGGHLGRDTKTIFTKFIFPLPKEAPHKISL